MENFLDSLKTPFKNWGKEGVKVNDITSAREEATSKGLTIGEEVSPDSGMRPVLREDGTETGVCFLENSESTKKWSASKSIDVKGDNFHNFDTLQQALEWSNNLDSDVVAPDQTVN